MRYVGLTAFVLAALLGLAVVGLAVVGDHGAAQDEEYPQGLPKPPSVSVTLPRFIVVFNVKQGTNSPVTRFDWRLIIAAKTEGEAIVKATAYVAQQFKNSLDMDNLEFVEAAPFNPEKKDEKKEEKK